MVFLVFYQMDEFIKNVIYSTLFIVSRKSWILYICWCSYLQVAIFICGCMDQWQSFDLKHLKHVFVLHIYLFEASTLMQTPLLWLHDLSLSNSYISLSVAFSHIFKILLVFFKLVVRFQRQTQNTWST
jgi:hypothetical protein